MKAEQEESLELLMEFLFEKYGHDFRNYSRSTMKRRVALSLLRYRCSDVDELLTMIKTDEHLFSRILPTLTVPVTEMFRDPGYFASLRSEVIPILRTYSSLKFWVAGCSTGEEAYSLAIVLKEEGLLDRSIIYATDINPVVLTKAMDGSFDLSMERKITEKYIMAGGTRSFSDYYRSDQQSGIFEKSLKEHILFSNHSLASDHVFSEVHLISCRNVLIYFNRELQDRAFGLFREALCPLGFLGLGAAETVRFSLHSQSFQDHVYGHKIFRKTGFLH